MMATVCLKVRDSSFSSGPLPMVECNSRNGDGCRQPMIVARPRHDGEDKNKNWRLLQTDGQRSSRGWTAAVLKDCDLISI